MRNFFKLLIIALALTTGFLITACGKDSGKTNGDIELCTPANVNIEMSGRAMTVSWDAADNAQGYEIVTTSVGCASGNRTINTKAGTMLVTSNGNNATNVVIGSENFITITLMAAGSDKPNTPMASSVTAKVKSLGGTISGKEHADSDYSEVTSHTIQK